MKHLDEKFLETGRQATFLICSLLVSTITGIFADKLGPNFTNAEQILFGAVTFAIFILLDILFILASAAMRQIKAHEHWQLHDVGDQEIHRIREGYARISKTSFGARDLFLIHFQRQLRKLADEVSHAADKTELSVGDHHFLSADDVLRVILGDDDPIYRLTWDIREDAVLFDEIWHRRYWEMSYQLLKSKDIKEARIIFIVDTLADLQRSRVAKLLDFIAVTDGFECRIIRDDHYLRICSDNSLSANCYDFGIFGSRLLFQTLSYEPSTTGVFSKDPRRIQHHIRLFDQLWDAESVVEHNPSKNHTKITLRELFQFDESQPRSKSP